MQSTVVSGKHPGAIYSNTPDHVCASCGPVFIIEWRVNTTMAGCNALHTECERFAKNFQHGIALLTIIQADAPPPGPKEREAIAKFLREGSSYIRCSGVVVAGAGFRAALVRGVVTGLTLLAKQAFPHKVVSLQSAVELFGETLSADYRNLYPQQLEADIERVRQTAQRALERNIIAA